MILTQQLQEMEGWQAARLLTRHIFQVCKIGQLSEDYQLREALQSTSLAVTNTLAETAFLEKRTKLNIHFNNAAQLCIKMKSLLYVIEDIGYLPNSLLLELHTKLDQVGRLIQEESDGVRNRFRIGFLQFQF